MLKARDDIGRGAVLRPSCWASRVPPGPAVRAVDDLRWSASAVGATLLSRPNVLLLDEPTNDVDTGC